jgi:hypothetical protein
MSANESRSATWIIHAKVQIFFLLLSVLSGAAFLVFRLPYSPQAGLVLTALAIAAVVHLLPVLVLRRLPAPPEFLGGAVNLLTVALVALLAGLSYVRGLALPLLFIAAPAALLAVLWLIRSRASWKGAAAGLIAVLGFGAILVVVNFHRYHSPFAAEMAQYGQLDLDTLYHFAITQMIRHFGEASIGIDGVVPMRYHTGSHFLFARLSLLAGGEVPYAYPLFSHVLLVPLLIRTFVSVSLDAARVLDGTLNHRAAIVIAFLFLLLYGSTDWDPYLHSNSYLVSLVLLMTLAPLALFLRQRKSPAPAPSEIALWACFALLAPLTMFVKVSVGTLLLIYGSYALLRSDRSIALKTAVLAAGWGLAAWVYPQVVATTSGVRFDPLQHDLGRFIREGRYAYLITMNIFTIAYCLFRLQEERIASFADLARAIMKRRTVDVEALLLVTFLGMGPGRLLDAWSAYFYFDNVQMWIAGPQVAGILLREVPWLRGRQRFVAVLRRVDVGGVAILILLAGAVTGITQYVNAGAEGTIARVKVLREASLGEKPRDRHLPLPALVERLARPLPAVDSPGRAAVRDVLALRERFGRALIVYVPPGNDGYWNIYPECSRKALVIPSLTGVPLLDGVPPVRCNGQLDLYGSHVYEDYAVRRSDAELGPAEICRRARAVGFTVVYALRSATDPAANGVYRCGDR